MTERGDHRIHDKVHDYEVDRHLHPLDVCDCPSCHEADAVPSILLLVGNDPCCLQDTFADVMFAGMKVTFGTILLKDPLAVTEARWR